MSPVLHQTSVPLGTRFSTLYPAPPRIHWAVLLTAVAVAEVIVFWLVPHPYRDFCINLGIAAWPVYFCVWIRRIDRQSVSLYWALASFVTGFLFTWLLWLVVIFEVREELLVHYNKREPIGLRLNWFLTLLFSFFYFQYRLRPIAKEKESDGEEYVEEAERFIIP
jgi:hypothetical protein